MKVVVIGHGMVGHKFLESLAKSSPAAQVTVLCEEPRPAYDRVHLTSYFSGKSADDLSVVAPGFFEQSGHVLRVGCKSTAINRELKVVRASDGSEHPYDKLVFATGSFPFVPPLPGKDRPGCFVYRTIEDLEAIAAASKEGRVGVVVGGGLLGLEAAKALHDLGLETHVVEFAPRLMAVQIDDGGGRVLRRKIEQLGVKVHTGKSTTSIEDGATLRHRMKFADGGELEADLIVFSAGIRPRDELAKLAGLKLGERGGIAIDNHCRTSDPDVYAIGECALWNGRIFGLVAPGYEMARVAAAHVLHPSPLAGEGPGERGSPASAPSLPTNGFAIGPPPPREGGGDVARPAAAEFLGADMSTKLKLMGVDVASIGDAHAATPGALTCSFVDEVKQVYKKLVVDAQQKRVLGAVLVGDAAEYGELLQMMLNGLALPSAPECLILPSIGEKKAGAGVGALPDAAQICSCNNVSKGAICAAVDGGATSIGALKTCTKAATSCGGCAPLVTSLLKHELKRKGVAVDNHLCEHFPYSRQQLYHLVRIDQLKSFDAVLGKHGKGLGCDICKPTVASILASCWNEFVLKREHAVLQDSNDYFLANIQKDGTYSVVPRVPGGEITAEKLIVIGQVAQKYGLY
ncbi:MAG TPA: FAD-dependent oxidoreductase, partial [Solimonas sp.]|nr:FAD-dependent oxidoreductase [Solimonas sp.]